MEKKIAQAAGKEARAGARGSEQAEAFSQKGVFVPRPGTGRQGIMRAKVVGRQPMALANAVGLRGGKSPF